MSQGFVEIKNGFIDQVGMGEMQIFASSGPLFVRLESVDAYVVSETGTAKLYLRCGAVMPLDAKATKEFLAALPQ